MKTNLYSLLSKNIFQKYILALTMLLSIGVWGQITEGFESGLSAAYTTSQVLPSGTWTGIDAFYKQTTPVHSGSVSCQFKATTGVINTPSLNTCGVVKFWANKVTTVSKTVGATTTALTPTAGTVSGSFTEYTVTVNDASSGIVITIKNATSGVGYIDDFSSTAYSSGYTVTYNGNTNTTGTAPTDSNSPYTSGATVTVLGNTGTLAKTGYNFTGWNTLATGLGTSQAAASTFSISANTTLYAKWTGNVTYNPNGGTGTTTDATNYLAGASVTTAANGFTRSGFTFAGWNTALDGSGINYAASTASAFNFSGNITLYAKWTSTSTIIYANFQFPTSNTINEGDTYTVYGRVRANGITNSAGQGAGISAWVGYSSTSTDPSTGTWTWVPLTYNVDDGPNNDEYSGLLGAGITPGTYNVVTRFQIGSGGYVYGGKNNAIWASAADNGSLTVNSNVAQSGQVYPPSGGPIVVGSPFMTYIQFYKPSFTETAGQGTPIPIVEIGYNSNDNNAVSGTGWTWLPASFDTQVGNNDQYKLDIGTARAEGKYYYAARIKMQGSTEYKYFGTSSFAYWNNDNGTFTVIVPPVITSSPLTKSSVYGTADTYTITASGTAPITYNATGLPTGLSINTATGVISGTPTSNVGTYNVSISANNGGGTDTKTLVWTITPKSLTITGVTGVNKIYDGTTVATLTGTPVLNTIVTGDDVSISGTPISNFVSKNVGTGKAITVTGYTLSGTKAGNYTVSQPTGLTANITAKALTVTGATAQNKVYDGTNAATITGTLSGIISPDVVTLNGTGTFASTNAGTGIAVTSTSTIAGADSGNYTLTQPTGLSADITAVAPTFTTSTITITVGGTYVLPGANISTNSGGALSYSLGTATPAGSVTLGGTTLNGIAVGTAVLTVNQAASGNYLAGSTTVTVNVTAFASGDFYSVPGTVNWNADASWRKVVGGILQPAGANSFPNNGTSDVVYITSGSTLSSNGSRSAKRMTVQNGGKFIVSSGAGTISEKLLIQSGGTVDMVTLYDLPGEFEIEDNGTFNYLYTNTSSRTTSIWAGTEKFHANSNFVIKVTQNTGGFLVIQLVSDVSEYNGACFGNLIIDHTAGKLQLLPAGFNKTLTNGNLIFRNAADDIKFSDASYSTTINGDLIIESTFFGKKVNLYSATSGTADVTVKGNIVHNGNDNLNINTQTGGTTNLKLLGDLTVGTSAKLVATSSTNSNFNFAGTGGDGLTAATTQTIDVANQSTASNIAFNVNTGAYAKLVNNNLDLGTASTLTVNGTFDADQKLLKGTTGTQTLTVKPTGTFKTANADGFSGSTTTSVGTTIETIALNTGSTVEYSGTNQTVTKQLAVGQGAKGNYSNLRISGSGVKTISGTSASPTTVINKTYVDASELLVASTVDTVLPNEFHADNGVEVNPAAIFRLANNANLIQASTSAAINTGSAIAEREAKLKFVSVATQADYNYWSSPVANQKLLFDGGSASFSPGTPNNRIFQYNEKTDYFVPTTDANFVAGKAYAIRAESGANGTGFTQNGTAKTFSFTGKPNNGDISTPSLNYTDAAHGFNLIGNPYPSNIDFNAFYAANTGKIDQKAYFWTNSVYQANQGGSGYSGNNYATYNGTGGVKATGGALIPTQFIKTGQGFLVQVKSAGALVFNNGMRVSGVSPFFNNKIDTERNRFWLTLTSPSGIVNSLLVGYVPNATNGLDANYDAAILSDTSDEFYSILDTEKLIIQGKENAFVTSDVVPLGTKYFVSGNYTITLDKKEGLFDTQSIYLKDKVLNTVTNLSEKPYEFTTSAGVNQNRFEIVYKPETVLATTDATKTALQVYRDMEAFVVKSNAAKITKVEVYDGSGRLVIMQNANSTEVRLNAASFPSGVYVLKIYQSETVVTKKIIK